MFCCVVVSFVVGYLVCLVMPDLRRRAFAAYMDYFTKAIDPMYETFKKEVFGPIKDIKSKIPELQKKHAIRILEIGVGTGTNFQFYPEGCHLVVVDPNPHFKKYYDANRAKFPQIKSEEIIVAGGENMDMVADNSIDVVVISLVLCSVNSTQQILQQVRRVLVPGGKLFFVEHIGEWDTKKHNFKKMFQDIFTYLRIWPYLFDGCELTRDTLKELEQAGFSKLNAKRKYAPIEHSFFQILNPHVVGNATK
uniref:Methyltransferase-like protein 7A n=1 Tax=Hirondellea gigas TaxID=1518452 RepID=A0A2P2HWY8_9CRUS